METEQRMYEIGYLLSPLIPEEKLGEEISVLRKLIEDKGGFVISEGRPKNQKLAYPIGGFETTWFGWMKFTIDPEALPEIKNPKIIRFLINKVSKEILAPVSPKKIIKPKKKKTIPPEEAKEKEEIKLEEIDKKLEELLEKYE